MSPHIQARLHFYKTSCGGRKGPLLGPWYGSLCELVGDPILHECRVLLNDAASVSPGQTIVLPITFWARPDLVVPKLHVGLTFFLTEGRRRIARGEVVEILSEA
jgi:hypothetical protein